VRALPTALLLALAVACHREATRPPNIVLISVDTMRRDALKAYDPAAETLPELDALAAQSVRFERAVSTASWTLPAHASMLTGLYADRHGATDPRVRLSPSSMTLAQSLQARGYETLGFTNGGFLAPDYGFARGFDQYDSREVSGPSAEGARDSVFDRAAARLAARKESRPFFLFLQTYRVHDYYRLAPRTLPQLQRPVRSADEYEACLQGTERCDEDDWGTLRALYAAELRDLDGCFGRLRDTLVSAGLWDRTVVVLTADHGEGFDPARGRVHHGGRLDEDVVRIPLLVRVPGLAPSTVETPVSLVDIVPTLLELPGAPVPADLDGRSFAPWLRGAGGDGAARSLYAQEFYFSWWHATSIHSAAIRAHPLALAVIEGDRWYLRSTDTEQVYDVATDPHQEHDLGAGSGDLPGLRARAVTRDVDRTDSGLLHADQALSDQLRALGYAQ